MSNKPEVKELTDYEIKEYAKFSSHPNTGISYARWAKRRSDEYFQQEIAKLKEEILKLKTNARLDYPNYQGGVGNNFE